MVKITQNLVCIIFNTLDSGIDIPPPRNQFFFENAHQDIFIIILHIVTPIFDQT